MSYMENLISGMNRWAHFMTREEIKEEAENFYKEEKKMKKQDIIIALEELLDDSLYMEVEDSNYFLENGIKEIVKQLNNDESNVIDEVKVKLTIDDQGAMSELNMIKNTLENINILIDRMHERLDRANYKIEFGVEQVKEKNNDN